MFWSGSFAARKVICRQLSRRKLRTMALLTPQARIFSPSRHVRPVFHSLKWRISCFSSKSSKTESSEDNLTKLDYKPGILDDFFLTSFRKKLVAEVGRDSTKLGYEGLIELVNLLLMKGRTRAETNDAAVRILKSLFPPLLLELYKKLISPLARGEIAAVMVARVTVLTCQWLMGPCKVNSVDRADGTTWSSGVFVERCRYLEESKCVGVCINTCKLPTQNFFNTYMGVPLLMEPNFNDYSCQFKFGVDPPLPKDDSSLREPCLQSCQMVNRRKMETDACPMA